MPGGGRKSQNAELDPRRLKMPIRERRHAGKTFGPVAGFGGAAAILTDNVAAREAGAGHIGNPGRTSLGGARWCGISMVYEIGIRLNSSVKL